MVSPDGPVYQAGTLSGNPAAVAAGLATLKLLKENPEAIVICRELGCGIVPIDPADRLWRDLSGEACQFLAGHSREVYRVICGIPMKLKGEDK